MSACEYCNLKVGERRALDSYTNNTLQTVSVSIFRAVPYWTIMYGVAGLREGSSKGVRINNCPMCGRELRNEQFVLHAGR